MKYYGKHKTWRVDVVWNSYRWFIALGLSLAQRWRAVSYSVRVGAQGRREEEEVVVQEEEKKELLEKGEVEKLVEEVEEVLEEEEKFVRSNGV